MHWHPSSESRPESDGAVLLEGQSRHTDKFHRCLGHVRANSPGYEPYGVCTASIGYSGSYTKSHRGGARTPAGRAKKVASGAVRVAREPRSRGVHWKPETERVYREDLRKKKRRSA